jgi:Mlc titration factor MtfA (ptsG expression regulator)
MNYYLALLGILSLIFVTVVTVQYLMKKGEEKRIHKLLSRPFEERYRSYLRKIPHYANLSEKDKTQIERSITIFMHTKEFIGVGLEVTDEMKVIIAFYACLLLLHITTENCYDNLKTIILYPTAVAVEKIRAANGIYAREQFLLDGEAANGTVVLIWHDAKREAYHLRQSNVILHEFAHEIDFMDGEIDGIPPIERSKYHEWTRVLFDDYRKLHEVALKNREWGKYKLLGSYAATNEAEFFAVVTERFFESPHALKKHFPELYKELKEFYKIEPDRLGGE